MFGLLAPGLSTESSNLDPLAGEQRRGARIPGKRKGPTMTSALFS
jgi:hypothetical protein